MAKFVDGSFSEILEYSCSAFWQIIVKYRQIKERDEEKGRKHNRKREFSQGGDVFPRQ